jgi:hypothetical protein
MQRSGSHAPRSAQDASITNFEYTQIILVSMLLLVLTLSGCGAQPGVPPTVSSTGVESAATPVVATAIPSPAATVLPPAPTDGGVAATASPSASGRDTTPPVVTLSADPPDVVPWVESATITATAQDNVGVIDLEVLLGDQVLATASDGDLAFDLIPGALDGVTPGGAYILTARARDAAGNVGQAALAVKFGPLLATPAPDAAADLAATITATYLPNVAAAGTPAPQVTPSQPGRAAASATA